MNDCTTILGHNLSHHGDCKNCGADSRDIVVQTPKIITTHVHPPIPIRTHDWSAHYDGYEEGHVGWGASRAEAIGDLLMREEADKC